MSKSDEADAHNVKTSAGQEMVFYRCRLARADDAAACAPLLFAAGARQLRFLLRVTDEQCIAFLRFAFTSGQGRFSWRRHRVACDLDGAVRAIMAAQTLAMTRFDATHIAWMLLRFFGPLKLIGMLRRGMLLEHEQPGPNPGEILITNGAADPRARGQGLMPFFHVLFDEARADGWLPMDGRYSCNVLSDNKRARAIYEWVGFVEQPRRYPPSPRLPANLISTRYLFGATASGRPAPAR